MQLSRHPVLALIASAGLAVASLPVMAQSVPAGYPAIADLVSGENQATHATANLDSKEKIEVTGL